MAVRVRVDGLRELETALTALPKATARNVLKRVLMAAGEPIAAKARELVRVATGALRDSIAVSSKLANPAGKSEFAAAMKAGRGKSAAVSAMRDARRAAGGGSFAEVYVGAGQLPHAHMVEFGSANNAPHPYLRPAWDAHKGDALEIIKRDLGAAIEKAVWRLASKQLRKAAKG